MLKALFWVQRRLGSAQSAAGFRRRPGVLFAGTLSGKLFRRQRTVCTLDTAAGRCPVSISLCLFAGQFALRKGLRRQYPLHAEAHRHTVAARSHGTGTVSGELFRQFCSNGDYAAPIPANGNVLPMQRRVAGELFGTGEKQQLPTLYRLVQDIIDDPALPIAVTTELGHQPEAHCLAYEGIRLEGSQL